ncbi:hypothetical protein Q4R40_15765 [Morganella morganii]|uniref:hypothetical protein n=2 Tax=Morganella morganii TaxID=582 RepID=UPI00091DF4DC|nr:hypothetical protein [Morganella morganii]MCW9737704.1 hypothetical protein [Morganella morganii]SGC52404.1 Uncharacterised protein [Mycobacterium tuberculosis]
MKVKISQNGKTIWSRDSENGTGMTSRRYLIDSTQQKIVAALIDALNQADGEMSLSLPVGEVCLTFSDEQLKKIAEELRAHPAFIPPLYPAQKEMNLTEQAILDRARGCEKRPVAWIVQVGSDDVWFSRVTNGRIDYDYAPVSRDKANVYASAILNDLEPPRHLQKSDKPTVQTQSEQHPRSFCLHSENPVR